jgi:uncharacterized membrane protein YgdD (TMEM256/DUF423 family)
MLAVALGAMGAHALKPKITPEQLSSYETAIKYQFYHGLGLLLLVSLSEKLNLKFLGYAANSFILGILLFSGSIYLLSTRSINGLGNISFLGPVTPLGGILFMLGWIFLLLSASKK